MLRALGCSPVSTPLNPPLPGPFNRKVLYCAPVWCRSAHTRLVDPVINDALRIVTGCLRPTPADNLPILNGIHPAELRRKGATLSLARRPMEPGHLLHSAITRPSSADARRLKSRHPFLPAAQQLISSSDDDTKCRARGGSPMECGKCENTTRHRTFTPVPPSWNGPAKNSVGPA